MRSFTLAYNERQMNVITPFTFWDIVLFFCGAILIYLMLRNKY